MWNAYTSLIIHISLHIVCTFYTIWWPVIITDTSNEIDNKTLNERKYEHIFHEQAISKVYWEYIYNNYFQRPYTFNK